MTPICTENERVKHRYFQYMAEALQRSEGTVTEARKCIHRFEQHTKCNFKYFTKYTAMDYKKSARNSKSKITGEPLVISTIESNIRNVKDFLIWLQQEPGYRSKIKRADIEYLNLSANEIRAAQSCRRREYPSIEQVIALIMSMPANTEVEKRDRAIIALLLLTCARVSSLRTLKMKHINIERWQIEQNPRDSVHTKFGKMIYTYFFPVGDEVREIFCDYYNFLKNEKLFSPNDPLFPQTKNKFYGARGVDASCISNEPWKNSDSITKIVAQAFVDAELPRFTSHSFRHTLAEYGERICKTPSEWKAWSLNIGHTHTSTTFNSYASMNVETQEKQMKEFWSAKHEDDGKTMSNDEMLRELMKILNKAPQED